MASTSTNVPVAVAPPIATGKDESSERPKQKRNRKGRGAKSSQSDRFRTKKNDSIYNEMKEGDQAFMDAYCKYDNLEDLMKSLSVGQSISHPPVEVPIVIQNAVETLAQETVIYLTNNKVQVLPNDEQVLRQVTKLQINAKVAAARRLGPFEDSSGNDTLVNATISHFSKGFKSSAVFLDQIGTFELDGQLMVPRLPVVPPAGAIPLGFRATSFRNSDTGEVLYVRAEAGVQLTTAVIDAIVGENRRWIARDVENLGNLVDSYSDLLQRASKKVSYGVTDIDLKNGKGTASQLVGSKDAAFVGREVDAWCIRPVPMTVLVHGAAWKFGFNSTSPWHNEETAAVLTNIDTGGFFKKIMRVIFCTHNYIKQLCTNTSHRLIDARHRFRMAYDS